MRRLPPPASFAAAALVAVMVSGAAPPWLAVAGAQEGWPMAGHDASHSGAGDGPAPPYEIAWSVEPGKGGPAAGVAAVDRAVVVVTREGVAAYPPSGGDAIWEHGRPEGPAGVPAIGGGLVLHAWGAGTGGQLAARDLETGELAWQAQLGSAATGGPTIAGDAAYVGTGTGYLVALDLRTGEERWRFRTRGAVTGAPAVAGGLVIATAYQPSSGIATVYALDEATGSPDGSGWTVTPGAVGAASPPAVAGDLAFVGLNTFEIRAIRLDDGREAWSARSRDLFGPRQVPAAGDQLVVADRTHVYRLDPEGGQERWAYLLADLGPLPDGRASTLLASFPAISGDTVLIGGADGVLSAIGLETGRRVWRIDLGDLPLGPIAVTEERILVVELGGEGRLLALEHDPAGRLVDELSPTVLRPGPALLNFAAAAAGLGAVLLLVFRVALRPRGRPE